MHPSQPPTRAGVAPQNPRRTFYTLTLFICQSNYCYFPAYCSILSWSNGSSQYPISGCSDDDKVNFNINHDFTRNGWEYCLTYFRYYLYADILIQSLSDIINVLSCHKTQKICIHLRQHSSQTGPISSWWQKMERPSQFHGFVPPKMLLIVTGHYTNAHHLVLWHLVCHLIANWWGFDGRHRVKLGNNSYVFQIVSILSDSGAKGFRG